MVCHVSKCQTNESIAFNGVLTSLCGSVDSASLSLSASSLTASSLSASSLTASSVSSASIEKLSISVPSTTVSHSVPRSATTVSPRFVPPQRPPTPDFIDGVVDVCPDEEEMDLLFQSLDSSMKRALVKKIFASAMRAVKADHA